MVSLSIILTFVASVNSLSRLQTRFLYKREILMMNEDTAKSSRGQPDSLRMSSEVQDRNIPIKEVVILGSVALQRMAGNTNHLESPLNDESRFLLWAKETSRRKYYSDKEFKERVKVRELKKLYSMEIRELEDTLKAKKEAFELNPNSLLLTNLDKTISNCEQACANMLKFLRVPDQPLPLNIEGVQDPDEQAVEVVAEIESEIETEVELGVEVEVEVEVAPDKLSARRLHVAEIYPLKQAELARSISEREALLQITPEYDVYMQCGVNLYNFLESIGVHAAEKHVTAVQKLSGKGRNDRGRSFENTADSVIVDHLLPKLSKLHNCAIEDLLIVRNIKLGMASSKGTTAELDSLVCIRIDRPSRMNAFKPKGSFCKVLAVIEVKRNPDDIGHAFLGYQRSLGWLSGQEDLYDPLDWQNKSYPKGHFKERPFLYDLKGETLMFSTESFAELRRKTVILSVPPELSQFSVADSNRSDTTTATATSPSPDPAPSSSSSSSSTSNPNPSSSSSHSSQVTGSESESGPATGTGTELGSGSESVSEGSIALFVEDLYFVAKDGPLDSVNSKAMSWVLNKISSESDFDEQLTDITAVENLRFRVNEKHPHKLSTSDLIQMYIRSNLTYQLFLIDEKS